MHRLLLLLPLILFYQGCQLVGEEEEQGIFFETDRSDYTPEDTIRLTFENRTGTPLSVRRGCDTGLQRFTETGWQPVVDPNIDEMTACALPGITYEAGFTMSSEWPIPEWLEYGIYRFEWEFAIERTLDRDKRIIARTEPFQYFVALPGMKM